MSDIPFIDDKAHGVPSMPLFSPDTKMDKLLGSLGNAQKKNVIKVKEGEDVFRMHVMTSAVSFVYEKLRTFIDYNEEHLLRKNAIYRILKRRFIEPTKIQKIAENLIKELIGAGYLPNEKLPESMKVTVSEVLSKYHLLFNEIQERKGIQIALKYYKWMLNLAAIELEEVLSPAHHEKVYIRFLFEEAKKRIIIEDNELTDDQKELYFYIAVHRSFVKSDRGMLNYLLLKLFYPNWFGDFMPLIPEIAQHIDEISKELDEPIDHKLVRRLMKKLRRYSMMVRVLRATVEAKETETARLNELPYLEQRIKDLTLKYYKEVRTKLRTAVTQAIIYVFLTKMLLALLIEVPFDYLVFGQLHYFSIIVNVTFPSLMLIFIAITTASPTEKNTQAMVKGIVEMLSGTPVKPEYLKPLKKRSLFTRTIFNILYVIFFTLPFLAIIYILRILDFSSLSIILFLAFLSIVSFFGTRIRSYSQDLIVIPKKETLGSEFVEFFSTPILRFGKWLSLNFSKVNIFAMFLDFIIETPLKLFLQVLEEWFGYFKERKDDVY